MGRARDIQELLPCPLSVHALLLPYWGYSRCDCYNKYGGYNWYDGYHSYIHNYAILLSLGLVGITKQSDNDGTG